MENKMFEGRITGSEEIKELKGSKLEMMGKCICKLNGISVGTGFFTKINYKNELIPALITNFHVIDDEFFEKNKQLTFYIEGIRKSINIDKNRKIYSSKKDKYDIMIIKLKKEDEVNNFLEIDSNIFADNSENFYKNEPIYLLHIPVFREPSFSSGVGFEKINEYDMKHKCNTDLCSSGGPIINYFTNKVIGIHKAYIKNINEKKKFNIGTFLKFPLNELKEQEKENKTCFLISSSFFFSSRNFFSLCNSLKEHESHKKEFQGGLLNAEKFNAFRLIKQQYKDISRNPINSFVISVGLINDNDIFNWRAILFGASDTSYKNGLFF